jgi:hypothetical protein
LHAGQVTFTEAMLDSTKQLGSLDRWVF